MHTPVYFSDLASPVGTLILSATDRGLLSVSMPIGRRPLAGRAAWIRDDDRLTLACRQLQEYFAGARTVFDLELDLTAGSDFQQRVWTALLSVPYGQSVSYAEIARRIDEPKAPRAVGVAIGSNPVAIIVPCHRVIGANGTLTGYAGGLERKRYLLALEQKHRQPANAARVDGLLAGF